MKYKSSAVIIVEGKSDVSFLETFIDADFVITNGSEISKETIEYIKTLKKTREIVVLTDPDFPGLQIRNRIEEQISGVKHAYVSKEKSIKKHKVGVAESTKEEVIKALETALTINNHQSKSNITKQDLYFLGFLGQENSDFLRKEASIYFSLGHTGTAKMFYKHLLAADITKEQLIKWKETIYDCK